MERKPFRQRLQLTFTEEDCMQRYRLISWPDRISAYSPSSLVALSSPPLSGTMEDYWDFMSHVLDGCDRRDDAPCVFAQQPLPPERADCGAMSSAVAGPLWGATIILGGWQIRHRGTT